MTFAQVVIDIETFYYGFLLTYAANWERRGFCTSGPRFPIAYRAACGKAYQMRERIRVDGLHWRGDEPEPVYGAEKEMIAFGLSARFVESDTQWLWVSIRRTKEEAQKELDKAMTVDQQSWFKAVVYEFVCSN